jgi:hypothetical protein
MPRRIVSGPTLELGARRWLARSPTFFWCPEGSPETIYLDRAGHTIGVPIGTAPFHYGGIQNQVTDGSAIQALEFATNPFTLDSTPFAGAILVTVPNTTSLRGLFLKIGGSQGFGFGVGNTTADDAGTNLFALRENVAWSSPGACTWRPGLNILSFGVTNQAAYFYNNLTAVSADVIWGSWNTGDNLIAINSSGVNRTSNCTVHAVGLWAQSFTNTEVVAFRQSLADDWSYLTDSLGRGDPRGTQAMFRAARPRPRRVLLGPSSSGLSGTASITLGALTSSAAGTVAIAGASSKTLGALTSSAAGTVALAGAAAVTLGALTSSAAGTVALTGTLAQTLGALTSAGAGALTLSGTLAVTLGAVTLSATGGSVAGSDLNVTLGALTLSASGTLPLAASAAITLAPLTATATGALALAGSFSGILGALTSSATGAISLQGAAGITLGALASSAQGALTLSGALARTLGALTLQGTSTFGATAFVATARIWRINGETRTLTPKAENRTLIV